MKLKKIFPVFICISIFIECKESKPVDVTEKIIAAGQMPAITKDGADNIQLVYGSGDSIMYASSNDKGVSFSYDC